MFGRTYLSFDIHKNETCRFLKKKKNPTEIAQRQGWKHARAGKMSAIGRKSVVQA